MAIIPQSKIASWIESNFKYKKRKNGTEYQICNPFDGDTGYHFEISITKGICNDWRGNAWAGFNRNGKINKCTFLTFVRRYLKCSYEQAFKTVAGVEAWKYESYKSNQKEEAPEKEIQIDLPTGSKPILRADGKIKMMLLNYLKSRGITQEDVERYDLHHLGTDLVWPYYEFDELVYWQSRSTMSKIFRFPPESVGVTKGEFLYGFDLVEPARHLILVEAIFDAMSLKDQTVATGGASLTDQQIAKIRAIGPKDGIILAPDNDAAGIKSVIYNGRKLVEAGYNVYYSIPREIPYEDGGEPRCTKDWNEILSKTDVDPLKDLESNVVRFDDRAAIKLRRKLAQYNDKSISKFI